MVERRLAKANVAGSNPVFRSILSKYGQNRNVIIACGCSSMAEFQPSKLAVWVRFPSPAPLKSAPIAQSDRVTDFESGGRRFESYWARQVNIMGH